MVVIGGHALQFSIKCCKNIKPAKTLTRESKKREIKYGGSDATSSVVTTTDYA